MRDRFVGDVGDFAKFGILRFLFKAPQRLCVVWYYVPPNADCDAQYTPHFEYLDQPDRFRNLDPDLFDTLNRLVHEGPRTVEAVEQSGLFPSNPSFFRDPLPHDLEQPSASRELLRKTWLKQALEHTVHCDAVFLDPDTGFPPKTLSLAKKEAEYYVFPDEIVQFHKRGQIIVIYQHRRLGISDKELLRDVFAVFRGLGIHGVRSLRWRPWAPRFFFIIPNAHLNSLIDSCIDEFLRKGWDAFFTLTTDAQRFPFPEEKNGLRMLDIETGGDAHMGFRLTGFQRAVLGITAMLMALRLFFPVQNCFEQFGKPVCVPNWSATYPQIVALLILAGAVAFLFPSPNNERLRAVARAMLGPLVLLGWALYVGAFVLAWQRGMRIVSSIARLDLFTTAAAIGGFALLVWLTRRWKLMSGRSQ